MVYLLSSLGCLPPISFCSKKPAGATWAKKNVEKQKAVNSKILSFLSG